MADNYTVELYSTREEWLKNRGIGGSDAAAIVGNGKWKNSNDIYTRITSHQPEEEVENERMVDGRNAEEHIRELFKINHKDLEIVKYPKRKIVMFRRKDYPLMTLSPDSIFVNKSSGKQIGVEFKDVELRKTEDKVLWGSNGLPNQYYFQILYYLVVNEDLEAVCLNAHLKHYSFNDKTQKMEFEYAELKDFWIYRDEVENHIKYLEKAVINFIEKNIQERKRPSLKINIRGF